jgi:Winged helix-turn-helix DNA-binding
MSLLDQVRKLEQEVVDRLKELEPLTREYDQLRKVAERLGLKYTPGSAKSDDGAKPSATRRRTAKPAAKRAARKPAKAQAVQSRGRSAAKPSPKPRGTRSTTAPKAKATGGAKTATRARPRKRAAASRQRSGGRRAAARPGQRHEDVLRLVGENPGITVREIGERLGVDATGLYRVVNQLTDEGRVRKDGTGLQPVDTTTTSEPKPAATTDTAKQAPPAAGTEAPAKEPEPSTAVAASAPSDDS